MILCPSVQDFHDEGICGQMGLAQMLSSSSSIVVFDLVVVVGGVIIVLICH